jgi:hypothetical protein
MHCYGPVVDFWTLKEVIFAVVPDMGEIDARLFAALVLLLVIVPSWLSWEHRRG